MTKFKGIIVGLVLVAFSGVVIYLAAKTPAPTTLPTGTIAKSAIVELTEWGDFQCPACGAYFPIVEKIRADFGAKLKFTFMNFPLQQHKNSKPSAYAAEAARLQGKFDDMYGILYKNQNQWSNESDPSLMFNSYAQSLDLDMNKFKADSESSAVHDKVSKEYDEGVKLGVDATPTFLINGHKIQPVSYEAFKKAIDDVLIK